jgi:hypothetical protein
VKVQIPFSQDSIDQIHLVQCGGSITIKADGEIVFQLDELYDFKDQLERISAEIEDSITEE